MMLCHVVDTEACPAATGESNIPPRITGNRLTRELQEYPHVQLATGGVRLSGCRNVSTVERFISFSFSQHTETQEMYNTTRRLMKGIHMFGLRRLQTVCSAGCTSGNCCFSEQVSDQRGSIPLTLFRSKAGCDGPVQLRLSLPFWWGFIYNPNCGNDDEESIGDYEALSHMVRRRSGVKIEGGMERDLKIWAGHTQKEPCTQTTNTKSCTQARPTHTHTQTIQYNWYSWTYKEKSA